MGYVRTVRIDWLFTGAIGQNENAVRAIWFHLHVCDTRERL